MKDLPIFSSLDEARVYLEERGKLVFHGRAGINYEYCVYTYTNHAGYPYRLFIYMNGRIDLK